MAKEWTTQVPAKMLSPRARRLLRNAGYELTVSVTLKRDDGEEFSGFDERGVGRLVRAWEGMEAERKAGIVGESALDGIARLVDEEAAKEKPAGHAKTKTVPTKGATKKRAAAKRPARGR